jgi:peptidoglycan-associated lipoprotein
MKLRLETTARLAASLFAALSVAACASHPAPRPQAPTPQPEAPLPPSRSESGPPPTQSSGPIPGSERDFVINVGDTVYFDFDKADIRADAGPVLDGQAGWLRRYTDVRVRVEGNCDERGTREYNFALGARRAEAVRSYLVAHGVAAGRITTISYGKERPVDPGTGETAWAHNRNGHTAITEGAR